MEYSSTVEQPAAGGRQLRRQMGLWMAVALPAHHGEEVTAVVIGGPRSIVFEQARNRLPTAQAMLHTPLDRGAAGEA